MNKKEEIIKILEENKLTNIHTPEDQIKSHKVGEVVPQDDIEKNIKWVLEEKIAPSVAQHNGKIEFVSYKK